MQTPNLQLPYIAASQAQKHVTHNAALGRLDALVQAAVVSRLLAVPPAGPVEGRAYVVAAPASGAWAGQAGKLAAFQDGVWCFYAPLPGWRVWIADEGLLAVYDGLVWKGVRGSDEVARLGINTTADSVNRLSVSAAASLFNHAGQGHQLKLNKAATAQTASLLLQSNFSGRAEIGLAGTDNLAIKTSPDGVAWQTALTVDATSGAVGLPRGLSAPLAVGQGGTGAATGIAALEGLGLRIPIGVIAPNAVAEVTITGVVIGVMFVVPNAIAGPAGSLFARMATTPQLVPLGIAGGALGVYTTALTGTTGTSGQVNMAALEGGRFQIENRRTTAISYTLYFLR